MDFIKKINLNQNLKNKIMKKNLQKIKIILGLLCISATINAQCPTLTITPAVSNLSCATTPVTFTANTTPSTGVVYTWLQPGGSTPLGGQYCTPGSAGVYTFVATGTSTTCTTTQTVSVINVGCVPSLTIVPTGNTFTITCVNCVTMQINASLTNTCGANVFTFWTNAAGTTTLTNGPTYGTCNPGNYRAVAINASMPTCSLTEMVSVSMNTIVPSVSVTASSPSICSGSTVSLTGGGAVSYTWTPGSVSGTMVVFSPTTTTTYTCIGTGPNGCTMSVVQTVSVSICGGINELSNTNADINLFPNPNKGNFTLRIGKVTEGAELQIMNSIGQLVFRKNVISGENLISTGNLAKGIYNYSVVENKRTVGKGKLIIE